MNLDGRKLFDDINNNFGDNLVRYRCKSWRRTLSINNLRVFMEGDIIPIGYTLALLGRAKRCYIFEMIYKD